MNYHVQTLAFPLLASRRVPKQGMLLVKLYRAIYCIRVIVGFSSSHIILVYTVRRGVLSRFLRGITSKGFNSGWTAVAQHVLGPALVAPAAGPPAPCVRSASRRNHHES